MINTIKPPPGTPVNFAHPLGRGIQGAWLMNDGGLGGLVDSLGKPVLLTFANTGVPTGSPFGGCKKFNGTTDGYHRTHENSYKLDTYTMAAWVLYETSDAVARIILAVTGSVGTTIHYIYVYQGGFGIVPIESGNTGYSSVSGAPIQTGVWTHLVGTYEKGGTVPRRLYINGVERVVNNYTTSGTLTANKVQIGRHGDGTANSWKGKIDNVLFYNRVLSPSEIKQLYTTPFAMFHSPFRFSPAAAAARFWASVIG